MSIAVFTPNATQTVEGSTTRHSRMLPIACVLTALAIAGCTGAPAAPPVPASPPPKVSEPEPSPPSPSMVPLLADLGTHHHPITTSSPLAQRYFDQGLRLTYAFNHEEAVQSFQQAARLDPLCAMCYWGVALALGPNINMPMDPAQEGPAYQAAQKALFLTSAATEPEKAYIEALARRYAPPPVGSRVALDVVYAKAMREVVRRYPQDLDAATLFAEALMNLHPWDYWTSKGAPKAGTLEMVATLERVLRANPNHPGACHYYIHAVEASRRPERALRCAERLADLMPGAGHMVHMPAHIYMRLGRYREAVESNARAAAVDHHYLEGRRPTGVYPAMYYPHNIHFLWAAASMEGRSAEALKAARELVTKVPEEAVRRLPFLETFLPTPLFALARFGRWEEILHEPPPPAEFRYTTGVWHYARGLAWAATGRLPEAADALEQVKAVAAALPPDHVVSLNSAAALLHIAALVLEGELAARRGQTTMAVRRLKQAVVLQDQLTYDEPPAWYYPVRQSLGAVLLQAGRAAEAEKVYREDLKRNPENGWSLYGLMHSLRKRGATQQAAAVELRFRKAWARADVQLPASRF